MFEKAVTMLEERIGLMQEIYKDLAQPGIKKVGQALETVLDLSNTILLPIKLANEKAKVNFLIHMDNYRNKITQIDDEDIYDVPPEIGIPIIDRLPYIRNEDIGELFVNFLITASSVKTIEEAHPSFIQVINSLSVDEAKIICYLKNREHIPFVILRANRKDGKGFAEDNRYLTGIEKDIQLMFPENLQLYINNLISCGILENITDKALLDENTYETLSSSYQEYQIEIQEQLQDDQYEKGYFHKGILQVTEYGKRFVGACTSRLVKMNGA